MNLDYVNNFLIAMAVFALCRSYLSLRGWTQQRETGLGLTGWLLLTLVSGLGIELVHKLQMCLNH